MWGFNLHEEANAILNHCKQKGYEKIIVVSGKLYTRRMRYSFKNFDDHQIEVLLSGFWLNQVITKIIGGRVKKGMIMVNNEYNEVALLLF